MALVSHKDSYTLVVDFDESPPDPREDDNLGTMVCFHRKYDVGDKHDMDFREAAALRKEVLNGGGIMLLLYGYEHGGASISVYPFSDDWDAGQLGYIYVTREDLLKEYGEITEETLNAGRTALEGEVRIYNAYLQNEVYEYCLYHYDEIVDRGGGIYWSEDIPKVISDMTNSAIAKELSASLQEFDGAFDIKAYQYDFLQSENQRLKDLLSRKEEQHAPCTGKEYLKYSRSETGEITGYDLWSYNPDSDAGGTWELVKCYDAGKMATFMLEHGEDITAVQSDTGKKFLHDRGTPYFAEAISSINEGTWDYTGTHAGAEFLIAWKAQQPDPLAEIPLTDERVETPRGSFRVAETTRNELEEKGWGYHHTSEDGNYEIMGNGRQAVAVDMKKEKVASPVTLSDQAQDMRCACDERAGGKPEVEPSRYVPEGHSDPAWF